MRIKHGDTGMPLHFKWMGMKQRVASNDPKRVKAYKGRGITVCERWQNYLNFKEDMLGSYNRHVFEYGEENTTLERVDNAGNYCPENCCWATHSEQNKNRRRIEAYCYE